MPAVVQQQHRQQQHYVYVLYAGNRTYTGYTVNPVRRLRQHNGELVGGAKSTRGRNDWQFLSITSCPDWDSQRALQVEWKYKHPDGKRRVPAKYRGVHGRLSALPEIWTRVPDAGMTVRVCAEHLATVQAMQLPANVTLQCM
jgi:predicted GIY-YIG superfamily endonuclease